MTEKWQPTFWQRPLFRKNDRGGWHWTRRGEFVYGVLAALARRGR
jgi:hypothetical protein